MFRKIVIAFAFIVAVFGFNFSALAESSAPAKDNILVLTLKNGDVAIRLRPDLAPKHVEQIKQLTKDGAYDHVVFHRVIDGFMAQTGDVKFGKKDSPEYDLSRAGTGGSNYANLPAEFSKASFVRGTVGMARSSDPNSANSQFFICFTSAPFLDGQYTVVGEVIKGMNVVDRIKKGDANNNGAVDNPDEIIKAHLETASN